MSENNWHTGTPTEEGYYLCHIRADENIYDICLRYGDGWDIGDYGLNPYTFDVIAWQRIEPYKETRK